MITFDILTIFPKSIEEYTNSSILKRAQEKGLVCINIHDLRKWSNDKHKKVDDTPYGGGAGMVFIVEPIFNALNELKKENTKIFITTPKGEKVTQEYFKEFSKNINSHYIIICGHYEGFDQRIHDYLVDYEFSIGDYVLSGGELPALVLVDGITRLVPGVLGNEESLISESFNGSNLDYPQYTHPEVFNGWGVPDILLCGDHKKISQWREGMSKKDTLSKRPDIV